MSLSESLCELAAEATLVGESHSRLHPETRSGLLGSPPQLLPLPLRSLRLVPRRDLNDCV